MRSIKINSLILILLTILVSCKEKTSNKNVEASTLSKIESIQTNLQSEDFKTIIDNKEVGLYWIENTQIKAAFTNYGGRLVGLWILDKNGEFTDVVVGMNSADGFKNSSEPYFGATIGRVGNRIAKGKFTLNGKEYTIPVNNGANTLHGGNKGFQDVVWTANKTNDQTLVLTYVSPDLEMGFPGNLEVKVTYSVTSEQTIKMEYEATTDQPTVVNLTNHAFFNLNGEGSGTILNHVVQFNANQFTPVDAGLIPLGEHKDVKGTPFDFTTPHTIGERINTENNQLKNGAGYDHNFVLNETKKNGMNYVGSITGDKSGIVMEVFTEEPGIQFYSGNFMKSENTFKSGATDDYRTAFALETQHYPDSPNQSNFPSITLNPKEKYHTISIYKFSAK